MTGFAAANSDGVGSALLERYLRLTCVELAGDAEMANARVAAASPCPREVITRLRKLVIEPHQKIIYK